MFSWVCEHTAQSITPFGQLVWIHYKQSSLSCIKRQWNHSVGTVCCRTNHLPLSLPNELLPVSRIRLRSWGGTLDLISRWSLYVHASVWMNMHIFISRKPKFLDCILFMFLLAIDTCWMWLGRDEICRSTTKASSQTLLWSSSLWTGTESGTRYWQSFNWIIHNEQRKTKTHLNISAF